MFARYQKSIIAGGLGSLTMVLLSFLAPMLDLPKFHWPALFSDYFHTNDSLSWMLFFGMGIFFAIVYGKVRSSLPFHSWHRGIFYALVLWGGTELILMPLMGYGFFSGSLMAAAGALMAYAVYGATMGYFSEKA